MENYLSEDHLGGKGKLSEASLESYFFEREYSCSGNPTLTTHILPLSLPLLQLRTLNVWGSSIENISNLSRCPKLEVISLSQNKIQDISVLRSCSRLRELYLRRNVIGPDLLSLACLGNLEALRIVWLDENPVCYQPLYRLFLIRICKGTLERIDTEVVTESERKRAFSGDNLHLEELAKKVLALNSAFLKEKGGASAGVAATSREMIYATNYSPNPLQVSSSTAVTVANAILTSAPVVAPYPLQHEGIVSTSASHHLGNGRHGGLPINPLVVLVSSSTKNSIATPPLVKAATPTSSSSSSSTSSSSSSIQSNPNKSNNFILKASLLLVQELSHLEGGEGMLKELSDAIFDTRSYMLKGGVGGGGGGGGGASATPRPRTPM